MNSNIFSTNRNANMRTSEVNICLRYGPHSNLVKSTGKECCESADESNSPVTASTANGHTHTVLFGNEAFYESFRKSILHGTYNV